MAKTIIVCGYGPGISNAVAERFGAEGFSVALVARDASRLAAGVKALEAKGIKAAAFPTDVGDAAAVKEMVGKVRASLGAITVIQWTAYANGAGDLLTASVADLHQTFDVAVTGVIAAVQAALPDLKQQEESAVLITNGGFGLADPQVDAFGVLSNSMGLSVVNAAKHKLVGILSERLKADGVFVGEVMVMGVVKGTAWDNGKAPAIDPALIGEKFWTLYRARTAIRAQVS